MAKRCPHGVQRDSGWKCADCEVGWNVQQLGSRLELLQQEADLLAQVCEGTLAVCTRLESKLDKLNTSPDSPSSTPSPEASGSGLCAWHGERLAIVGIVDLWDDRESVESSNCTLCILNASRDLAASTPPSTPS